MMKMWLIKSDEETDQNFGKRPEERTVEEMISSSLIIIDKQPGPTSHQITAWIKNMFKLRKVGHAGTLDPLATGVLPVALENATKAMPVLMSLDKEFVGIMHLHKEVQEEQLMDAIKNFIGKIEQLPPVKSAVARRLRERRIYFFDVLEKNGKDVLFEVGCEAGTYIRKLCHDIGITLGVGAHLAELRRTKVGGFIEEKSFPLLFVRDAYELWREGNDENIKKVLIPIEYAILHVKRIFARDSAVDSICNGSPLFTSGVARIQEGIKEEDVVAVYSLKEELIALGKAKMNSKEMFENPKGVAIKTDRVFMKRGTYPSFKN